MNVSDNVCGRGDSWSTMTECNPCYRNLCYHAFGNEEEVVMAKENGKLETEAKSLRPRQKSPNAKAEAKSRGFEAKAEAKKALT